MRQLRSLRPEISYPLRSLPIINSGTTLHIFNEIMRFKLFKRLATDNEFTYAGSGELWIQALALTMLIYFVKMPKASLEYLY